MQATLVLVKHCSAEWRGVATQLPQGPYVLGPRSDDKADTALC
jgi:hypothetical protein